MSTEEWIDKLEQLILDEDELVTYKVLSKELKIHVNEAKKYLHDFLTVQNSKEEVKLYAYYFLSGFVVKDGIQSQKIVVVSEDNLAKVKKEFKEVTSCHIYSLNKGGRRDESSLFNSQSWCKKWAEEHREYSAIKHLNIVKQVPVIKRVEVKKDPKLVSSKAPAAKQIQNESVPSLFENNNKEVENSLSAQSSASEKLTVKTSENNADQGKASSSTKSSSESKDPKKSTLSSLWQKLEDKSKNGKNENSKTETKGKKATAKTVGKNNIMSMFSKQAEKNAVIPVKKTANDSSSSSEHISPVTERVATHISPKTENKAVEEKIVVQVKNKRKSSRRQTKRSSKQLSDNESDEEVKPTKKKHRRICTMDDSDSESENEEAQDKAQRSLLGSDEPNDVAMHVSDDSEEPIPPTPPVLLNKGKKKIWKTVQKTFEDEDGFLVAKQEKVLVSASDSDEDPVPSKKSVSKTEPKENTFLYRKQASLTSFFNKR